MFGRSWIVAAALLLWCLPATAGDKLIPLYAWGASGTGAGEFIQPFGVAIGPDGHVYVADQVNQRVQKFLPNGQFVMQFRQSMQSPLSNATRRDEVSAIWRASVGQ